MVAAVSERRDTMQNLIDGLRAVETARKALVLEGTKEEQLDLQIRVLSTALHYFIQAFGPS